MWFRGLYFVLAALAFFLTVPPGWAALPTGHPLIQTYITLEPIVYQGPTVSDITLATIEYQGPVLTDITVPAINYSGQTAGIEQLHKIQQNKSQLEMVDAGVVAAMRIPGVAPRIKIVSPVAGQKITGNVLLEVKITGWRGVPQVYLEWEWGMPAAVGEWPAGAQKLSVVGSLNGKSKILIPHASFPKAGVWRLGAEIQLSETLKVRDDTSFTLVDSSLKVGTIASSQLQLKPTATSQISLQPISIPQILTPKENQRITAPGRVPVTARLQMDAGQLLWEVTYKPFGKNAFNRQQVQPRATSSRGRNTIYSGTLKLDKPGYYRLRAKVDSPAGRWSQWRSIRVGSPVLKRQSVVPAVQKKPERTGAQSSAQEPVGANTSVRKKPRAPGVIKKPAIPEPAAENERGKTPKRFTPITR